jgi:hypothetical protein
MFETLAFWMTVLGPALAFVVMLAALVGEFRQVARNDPDDSS